jgi:squalene synthase HpnC
LQIVAVDHYENFPVASFLMPARLRPAVRAIYRFARHADDLADEGDAPAEERLAALAALDASLQQWQAAGQPPATSHRTVLDLAPHVDAHGLHIMLLRDLLSAFSQDVTTLRYPTFDALGDYCRRSANPVGRLLLQLYGMHGASQNRTQSDAICTALQLINFWQDVAIDLAKQRIYLPQEDLHRFSVDEARLLQAPADIMKTDAWCALMQFEVDRATALMRSGAPLAWRLPGRIGWELRAVVHGGLRIAQRLQRCAYDVTAARPVLAKRDWALIAWRSLLPYPR